MDQSNQIIKLHPDAKIISFEHKHFILNSFNKNIGGMLGIDYFSLILIDKKKQISLYSTCPSLEYSLIKDNFWTLDGIFDVKNHQDSVFYFWNELYNINFKKTLIKEKETKFGFLFGFCVMRQMKDIFAIYSFATKTQKDKDIYRNSKDILLKIGDCLFDELKSIHGQYVMIEKTEPFLEKASCHLTLVIDNTTFRKWPKKINNE